MNTPSLNELEQNGLSLTFRFLIALPEEFGRLLTTIPAEELESALHALEHRHGYLKRVPLFANRVCYQLTSLFGRDFDVDFDATKELKPQRIKRAFGMLKFCCDDSSVPRKPLTGLDFAKHLSEFADPRINCRDYFIAWPSLGLFILDNGTEDAWGRLLLKCKRSINKKHRELAAYSKQLAAKQFELGVVTPFESKAERLREAIARHTMFDDIAVNVLAVPELSEF